MLGRLGSIVLGIAVLGSGLLAGSGLAQDSGAASFTIASANGNVVIKRADGSAEMASPGTKLNDGDLLSSVGRSEASVNLGSGQGSLFLFSDTTLGIRSPGSSPVGGGGGGGGGGGAGSFYIADLASGVVLARTVSGSGATVQITNETAGAVAQVRQGGMSVATDVDTGNISVACDDRRSEVAFPYLDMRVPCEENVVRTLTNKGDIVDERNDSGSPVTGAVEAAMSNPDGQRQNETQSTFHDPVTRHENQDTPEISPSPSPIPISPH